uniref:Uncharacterized protein n=1 Tax=Oryza glumipatula TaxID=40148 RepID=A0A0E0B923_9ORYZ
MQRVRKTAASSRARAVARCGARGMAARLCRNGRGTSRWLRWLGLAGCRAGGAQQGNQTQWEHFQHEVETTRTMRGELVDALKLTLQLLFLGFREEGGMWA